MAVRNRILRHQQVRAGDLVPHELNPREHGEEQREALQAIYDEVGFARSLLAYQLPDGRLKLIDGHLRARMDPEQLVEVEVLDVTDEEARALLLTIDPLAQLADYNLESLQLLRQQTETSSEVLGDLWQAIAAGQRQTEKAIEKAQKDQPPPEQYLILITCRGEKEQKELLEKFANEGLSCKALVS